MIPKFESKEELGMDLAQMYYYHDCIYRDNIDRLPGTVIAKIKNSKDSGTNTPLLTVFRCGNLTYFVFRSTKSGYEIRKDMEFSQVNRVHQGVREIYKSIRSEAIANLRDPSCNRAIIFGHSLGGAVVDIFITELIFKYPELWSKCFAFSSGGPRVYDPVICDVVSKRSELNRYIKIINEADMVPTLPSTVTTIDGIFSTGKKFYFKSLCNKSRVYRFNVVIERQLVDSHISKTYADALWASDTNHLPDLPYEKNIY